jgi:hypothetical protein
MRTALVEHSKQNEGMGDRFSAEVRIDRTFRPCDSQSLISSFVFRAHTTNWRLTAETGMEFHECSEIPTGLISRESFVEYSWVCDRASAIRTPLSSGCDNTVRLLFLYQNSITIPETFKSELDWLISGDRCHVHPIQPTPFSKTLVWTGLRIALSTMATGGTDLQGSSQIVLVSVFLKRSDIACRSTIDTAPGILELSA